MKTVSEILMEAPGLWLRFCAMMLLPVQLGLLLRTISQKRGWLATVCAAAHALFCLLLLTLLLDGAYRPDYLPYERALPGVTRWFLGLPWAGIAGAELLSALLCALTLQRTIRYQKSHPSAQSVKQTVDLLPTGICISGDDGLPLLSNLQMNACNLALTGSVYTDANTLWQTAQVCGEQQGDKLLVCLEDGRTLLMAKAPLQSDGRQYLQITAEDVTEQYCMTAELTEKNHNLRELQQRLKEYRKGQTELVIREELLSARTTVHNQLGGALLTGKYHLEHPDSADPETLQLLLRHLNTYLLSEAEEPENGADPFECALKAAMGFGVQVALEGEVPAESTLRALLGQAIVECAANTVKHAGGDRLTVRLDKRSFTVTNNGVAPTAAITPVGGLRSLQLAVEQAGGSMELEGSPAFRLTVRLPK